MDKNERGTMLKKCALIVVGAVLYAAGMGLFLSPNHLAPGGVTGIAVILNSAFGLPTGITAFVLNIPLFLIAIKAFGFRFFSATLAATTLASLLIDVFDALPVATNDLLLAAFAGGAMNAVGISLIFKAGATTGGTDIIVKLIRKRYPHIRTGRAYLYTDVVILLAAGIVLSDINLSLYAAIAMIVSTTLMDVVLYGPDEAKQVYIVSDRESEIAEALLKLDVGITLLNGEGAFTGRTKKIILCVMRKSLYPAARDVVRRIDKTAFMIVSSATEVFGEGFKRHDSADL